MKIKPKNKNFLVVFIFVGILGAAFFIFSYNNTNNRPSYSCINTQDSENVHEDIGEEEPPKFVVTHIETPEEVKAVYMTSWVAGTPNIRSRVVKLVEDTEINSIVIDIKDYSGKIAFHTDNEEINKFNASENRISDIMEFIGSLHDKDIYVIGRITVFQDPNLTKERPDLAVKRSSDGGVWKDYKGLSFTDPGFREVWDYHVEIGKESYNLGFDELNFDYIRFPSDGNMKDIYYPASEEELSRGTPYGKAKILKRFFSYLDRKLSDTDVPISADLFGMTMTNTDDLNIGQILEYAEPHFDFIAPMVYPSHYPKTFLGFSNPAEYPYEIIKHSMDAGVKRLIAASSSPNKLRPWLQDFDLGAEYTSSMVRLQIDATYDAGLTSWMLWDPTNVYTRGALLDE